MRELVGCNKSTKLQLITSETPNAYRKLDAARTDEKTKTIIRLQPFHAGDELVELLLGVLVLHKELLCTEECKERTSAD